VLGVVLAGGDSRRMGRTKGLVEIEGIPMARRVADALRRGGCDQVVIVGGDVRELRPLGLTVAVDLHPGEGPLGGVLTALAFSARPVSGHPGTERPVFVAPCDVPALSPAVVRTVLERAASAEHADAVVARSHRLEPALAIWNPSAYPSLEAAFARGERALHRVLGLLRVEEVPVEPAALRNVNSPADLGGDVVDDPGP
jgi:molybdopterin-guanine dinucleotide biosynthesis protein A